MRATFAALTPRERTVFDRIVASQLNKQITDALGIAERTIKLQARATYGETERGFGGRTRPAGRAVATPVRLIPGRIRGRARLCPFGQILLPFRLVVAPMG
ncbi:MAG: LuxR C-terminal-related transcriptional regulator [Candidatus Competibacteraceae bacterium]